MSTLVCPYCYNSFPERKIVFRCTGQMSTSRLRCEPERDAYLDSQLGIVAPVPPWFAANGRHVSANCPRCHGPTSLRICPHCHSQLPVLFGKIDSRLVAMIGAKFTGKTVYVTVLLHELMHRIGQRFDAAVVGSDDHTRKQFSGEEQRLYERRELPDTTKTTGADRRPPLVFRFSRTQEGRLHKQRRHTIMSFLDTAGEDFESQQSVDHNLRYLSSANGIILLLDPSMLPGVRNGNGRPEGGTGPTDRPADQPINVLSRVTELLQLAAGGRPDRLIQVPMAVAFSKIDALWDNFPEHSPLRQPAPNRPYFDQMDSLSVHEHVQSLLHTWDNGQIDQLLTKHYRTFRYFGLSALGNRPTSDRRISGRGIQPYRVEDPLLWLLSHHGIIPTAGG